MKFLIVGHALHKENTSGIGAYGPYVREMNLWLKHADEVRIVGPKLNEELTSIDLPFKHDKISIDAIPSFDIASFLGASKLLLFFPVILFKIIKGMAWADHIHLRCPGNVGLIGAFAQVIFPKKVKTAKYAGNWDFNSSQPWSYRLQQKLLRNVNWTKNIRVLVYGEWEGESKNVHSFFTASYSESQISQLQRRNYQQAIKLVFVGGLNPGKRPLLSLDVAKHLVSLGYDVELNFYGEGPERKKIEATISENGFESQVFLHGNVNSETVERAFRESHFLVFASKSEGWPKVVSESMFWGCIPLTTAVSCVPMMVGKNKRGILVSPDGRGIADVIVGLVNAPERCEKMSVEASRWSQQFTLEKFESEVSKLLKEE